MVTGKFILYRFRLKLIEQAQMSVYYCVFNRYKLKMMLIVVFAMER